MNATIFLGPSMPLVEARSLLPGAVFRPPAAQGDLLAAVDQDRADIIGLVDGTFRQNLSVWHNESFYLLSRGVSIYGASSMGALRASETNRFGAVGVGKIYRWYKDGTITGDDEVALLHGDAQSDYISMSLPLVNVRESMNSAVSRRRISATDAQSVVDVARGLYYPDRTFQTIVEGLATRGASAELVSAAKLALTTEYVDLKREDAGELLKEVRDVIDGSRRRPERIPFEFHRSGVFETLYNLDRNVSVDGVSVSMQDIREHIALHDADYMKLRRSALDRAVVVFLRCS